MSDLHDLCRLERRPVDREYVESVKFYLKSGIPATYTIEEAYNYTHGIEEEPTSTTTPLHIICQHYPQDAEESEKEVIREMVSILLEYGAGWCHTDINGDTPGCILIARGLKESGLFRDVVEAGVRAELLLRKVEESNMEFIEDTDELEHNQFADESEHKAPELQEEKVVVEDKENLAQLSSEELQVERIRQEFKNDPSNDQKTYLQTKLEYQDDALVTNDRKDGVMMAWETDLMRHGSDSLFKGGDNDSEVNILNIGFGMGIIDTFISEKQPTKHYICEAHPDVLNKLRADGWYQKSNVVILEGRWQDQLNKLLSQGKIYFNGIYYDTYSEHYEDMLDLFDLVVGLLKPHGVFSFFNGLGADRQVVYEVYKELVVLDLRNYGLNCTFEEIPVPATTFKSKHKSQSESVWDGIKRSYWTCPVYYHPEVRFIDA